MSELTANNKVVLNTAYYFEKKKKKMMKLYEDEQPEVTCIPQDEINESSVREFYVYNDYYANKVDGVLRVTTGPFKDEDCEYRYLERAVKFYQELDESCFVVSPYDESRDYNGMIKFIYNSFIKGNSVFVAFQEYAGTPIRIYTHWARATKEFSPKEHSIEDVLRAIGRDFWSCIHA